MNEARKILEEVVEKTNSDIKQAKKHDPKKYDDRPSQAIQLFYPDLNNIQNREGLVYASCLTGHNIPPLLSELLLGMPVLANLYNINDLAMFKRVYRMTPEEFAVEAKENRLIPIIYQGDPRAWRDNALELIQPILQTGKVQLSHLRTRAFEEWFTNGKLSKIERKANKIFEEYFRFKQDEAESLYRQLRIPTPQRHAKGYRNTVIGRLRNLLSICPQLEPTILTLFSDLRNKRTIMRARALNGLKNIVVSPITAGRGGLFRASREQIEEIESLTKLSTLRSVFDQILDSDLRQDFFSTEVIDFFEKNYIIPTPKHLDYHTYFSLVEQPFWQDFRSEIARVLSTLRKRIPASQTGIAVTAEKEWEGTINKYQDCYRSYRRVENIEVNYILAPLAALYTFVSYGLPTGFLAAKLGMRFLWKIEKLCGTKGPLAHPGRILAQLIQYADQSKWPIAIRTHTKEAATEPKLA